MARLRGRKAIIAIVIVALLASSSILYLNLTSSGHSGSSGGGLPAVVSTNSSSPEPSKYITEYQVGGVNSQPNAIAIDSHGGVWFTLGSEYSIGVLNPSNGTTHEFRIPDQNGSLVSWGIAVDNTKGLVWFTDQLANSVWSFSVSSHSFARYELPTSLSSPYQVAVDGSGNVWFTEIDGGRIGEITSQGAMKEYTVPAAASTGPGNALTGPAGITIGKGGVVWFTEVYVDSVGSLANGKFHRYPLVGASSPTGIAMDSAGKVWVTLHGGSDIAELDPATNSTRIISTSVPSGVQSTLPYFVVVDPQGNVWFDEHYGNAIARFTPANQTLVEYEIPTRVASLGNISAALTIGLDPAGHPWFTEFYTGKVGTIDSASPVSLRVSVGSPLNGSVPDVSNGGTSSIPIQVTGSSPSTLEYSEGAGPTVQISFSAGLGNGSYSSTMTVTGPGEPTAGVMVEVTISAVTPQLVCSQVVEIEA